jgi:AcrR family transcriptional regulator
LSVVLAAPPGYLWGVVRVRPKRIVRRPAGKRRRVIRRLDNDERRAQLLAMGRTAFATHPYDEVSIDELAKKAKISKGLFYYYFPTKRELYIAGLQETSQELLDRLITSVAKETAPRARASAGVDAYLAHVEALGSGFIALMRGGIGSDPEVAAVLEGVRAGIVDEFMRGAPISAFLEHRPLSRIAIRSWIGMVEAASIEWLASKDVPRAGVRDLLVDLLFDLLTRVLGADDADRFTAQTVV